MLMHEGTDNEKMDHEGGRFKLGTHTNLPRYAEMQQSQKQEACAS